MTLVALSTDMPPFVFHERNMYLDALYLIIFLARQMEESGSQDCDPAVVAKVAEILGVTRDELLKVRTRVKLFVGI